MNKKVLIFIVVFSLVLGIVYTSLSVRDVDASIDETDINTITYENESEASSAFTTEEIYKKEE